MRVVGLRKSILIGHTHCRCNQVALATEAPARQWLACPTLHELTLLSFLFPVTCSLFPLPYTRHNCHDLALREVRPNSARYLLVRGCLLKADAVANRRVGHQLFLPPS